MYLTDRTYQLQLCDFMLKFKPFTFSDHRGHLNKINLFDEIYRDHIEINHGEKFDVDKNVTCQLLWSGHHPTIHSSRRDFVDFNEPLALKEATHAVLNRHAILVVRDKVRQEQLNPIEVISLVVNAMQHAYELHSEIDKEIELMIK